MVGKPNTGKSTFFAAATLVPVKIAPYPFTTIEPNIGIAYVRTKCVCKEFNVKDNPKNSLCINGNRFIPIQMMDVAGLVPDAWKGRGLGNRFLDELRKASVLIHVVDASGGTDEEGRIVPPGTHDPCKDVEFLEREIVMWIKQILTSDWQRIIKRREDSIEDILAERLSGLQISRRDVEKTLEKVDLTRKKLGSWSDEDITKFCYEIRRVNKPIIIAANKIDVPAAEDGFRKLKERYGDSNIIIPCSAEAELVLRRAAEKGFIRYLPGDEKFEIIDESKMTSEQRKALKIIEEKVLVKWKGTGVQETINAAIFNVLKMIVVYPVEDVNKLSDHHGNVLPDALLIKEGSTAKELAYMIHQELGDTFLYAIDVRTKHKIGENTLLKMNDIIKIVATKARK
ncbi:redox-regulated ATPase YchF [Candidatus Culexarchaeum yellowstonense]|uniref:redox-regulated ATPase YchF n=1 Tax=Candidatus Culexarchaeum yellowstonense TaxID=2928963 RepID=UPI0026EB2BFD|nr:redox-regulated ATPase YchF [Candidatus Culexarchaeum yellowstonense]